MPKLLPLSNPEDWRMDDTGHVLVHRAVIGKGKNQAVYTLYEIRRVTWATSVKHCLAALSKWLHARKSSERQDKAA